MRKQLTSSAQDTLLGSSLLKTSYGLRRRMGRKMSAFYERIQEGFKSASVAVPNQHSRTTTFMDDTLHKESHFLVRRWKNGL